MPNSLLQVYPKKYTLWKPWKNSKYNKGRKNLKVGIILGKAENSSSK